MTTIPRRPVRISRAHRVDPLAELQSRLCRLRWERAEATHEKARAARRLGQLAALDVTDSYRDVLQAEHRRHEADERELTTQLAAIEAEIAAAIAAALDVAP